jgi:hypothetical protein
MILNSLRHRFWLEVFCAVLGSALFVLTLFFRDWIEVAFGIDPDNGSGALEYAIVIGLLAIAAVSALMARHEWRLAARRR